MEGLTVDPHMIEVEIQHRAKVRIKLETGPSLRIPTRVQGSANGPNWLREPSADSERRRRYLLSVERARCEDSETQDSLRTEWFVRHPCCFGGLEVKRWSSKRWSSNVLLY